MTMNRPKRNAQKRKHPDFHYDSPTGSPQEMVDLQPRKKMKKKKQNTLKNNPEILYCDYDKNGFDWYEMVKSMTDVQTIHDIQFFTNRPQIWKDRCFEFFKAEHINGSIEKKPIVEENGPGHRIFIPSNDTTEGKEISVFVYDNGSVMVQGSGLEKWSSNYFPKLLGLINGTKRPTKENRTGQSQNDTPANYPMEDQPDPLPEPEQTSIADRCPITTSPQISTPVINILTSTPNSRTSEETVMLQEFQDKDLLDSLLLDEAASLLVQNEVYQLERAELIDKIAKLELQVECKIADNLALQVVVESKNKKESEYVERIMKLELQVECKSSEIQALSKSRVEIKSQSNEKIQRLESKILEKENNILKADEDKKKFKSTISKLKSDIKGLSKKIDTMTKLKVNDASQSHVTSPNDTRPVQPTNSSLSPNTQNNTNNPLAPIPQNGQLASQERAKKMVDVKIVGDTNVRGLGPRTKTKTITTTVTTLGQSGIENVLKTNSVCGPEDYLVISCGKYDIPGNSVNLNCQKYQKSLEDLSNSCTNKHIIVTEIPPHRSIASQKHVTELNKCIKSKCLELPNVHFLETDLDANQINGDGNVNSLGKLQVGYRIIRLVHDLQKTNFQVSNLITLT